MALYINDYEVDSLVSQLAQLDHTSKVETVRRVLREEIARRERDLSAQERMQKLNELAERTGALIRQTGNYKPYTKEEADEIFSYIDEEAERRGH